MIEPRGLSLEEAREAMGVGFVSIGGTTNEPPTLLIADMLRETLCMLARPPDDGEAWQPVYVTRLTNSVRRRLVSLWPQTEGLDQKNADTDVAPDQDEAWLDLTRTVLRYLEDIGDVIDCGNGYWLPAPIRFVKLPVGRVIVLAGFSTRVLCRVLGGNVRNEGFARALYGAIPPPEDNRWQDLVDWRGAIPELRNWTQATIATARKNLKQSAQGFVDFEIYVPRVRHAKLQYYRWVNPGTLSEVPHYLVLCRSVHGLPRNYWLGELRVTKGSVVLIAEAAVPSEQVRRLQYGLDLEAGTPTEARMIIEKQRYILFLQNPLPPAERRLLLALAQASEGFVHLPYECSLSEEALPEVLAMLMALGINVTESDPAGVS